MKNLQSVIHQSFFRSPYSVSISTPPNDQKKTCLSSRSSNSSCQDEYKRKSQYLEPTGTKSISPTVSHSSSVKASRTTTPTSPMLVKLFQARMTELSFSRESIDYLSKTKSQPDIENLGQSPSSCYPNRLSPPCHSPAISHFRKKTSPSLINLKSPDTSPRNCNGLSPTPYSPPSTSSSINISPDYNLSNSPSPSTKNSSSTSIFSFNVSDHSLCTPSRTPQSPRSPLSPSFKHSSLKNNRPMSPLVMTKSNDGEKKKIHTSIRRKTGSVKRKTYSEFLAVKNRIILTQCFRSTRIFGPDSLSVNKSRFL